MKNSPGRSSVKVTTSNYDLNLTFSLTLMTTLNPRFSRPFTCAIRKNSNSAQDFLTVFKTFVENDLFEAGDYLIMDNCSIHVSQEIMDELTQICQEKGIKF